MAILRENRRIFAVLPAVAIWGYRYFHPVFTLPQAKLSAEIREQPGFRHIGNAHDDDADAMWEWGNCTVLDMAVMNVRVVLLPTVARLCLGGPLNFSLEATMCHCTDSSNRFADPLYRCPTALISIVQANASQHPEHFSSPMLEASEDDFTTFDGCFFRCKECDTAWFMEWCHEETCRPIFGVKADGAYTTSDETVSRARNELLALLLGGESEVACAISGCQEQALRKVAHCARHYGFPW